MNLLLNHKHNAFFQVLSSEQDSWSICSLSTNNQILPWTWDGLGCAHSGWSNASISREVPTWFAAQGFTRRKKRMPPHLSPASSAKAGSPLRTKLHFT